MVLLGQVSFDLEESGQLFQLGTQQGRIDVGHSVVVSRLIMEEFPSMGLFGLCGQMFGFLSQFCILCEDDASATSGDGFVSIETQGAKHSKGAAVLAIDIRTQRFRGIFNQGQAVLMG